MLVKNAEILVYVMVFVSMAVLVLMNLSLKEERRQRQLRKARLKEQREQILGRSPGRVERYVTSERELVEATKTDMKTYLFLMIGAIAFGLLFGKLVFSDTLLSFIAAGFCIILPHALLVVKGNRSRRADAERLESAMRIITHEYISTLDIEKAVQNSVDIIDHDKPFREFLVDCKMISNNIERNLRRLESKEHNMYFSRWIDQLILVQSDRTQIVNLMPILDDMNDAKTAQHQCDTKVSGAWRDYFTLLFIILLSPLLVRFVQYEWYSYLVTTAIGKLLVVLLLTALAWSTFRAMKINKSIM